MLTTMYVIAHMHGSLAIATWDFPTMQLCLSFKKEMAVTLKDYKPVISCEPKLGEI